MPFRLGNTATTTETRVTVRFSARHSASKAIRIMRRNPVAQKAGRCGDDGVAAVAPRRLVGCSQLR